MSSTTLLRMLSSLQLALHDYTCVALSKTQAKFSAGAAMQPLTSKFPLIFLRNTQASSLKALLLARNGPIPALWSLLAKCSA